MKEAKVEKARTLSETEFSVIGEFKIKSVRMLVDINGHTRELTPQAKTTKKFLEKEKAAVINAVKITDKQEAWLVRIPDTFPIAGIIRTLYESGNSDDERILKQILYNYANVTTVTDGLFHSMVLNCCTIHLTRADNSLNPVEKRSKYDEILGKMQTALHDDLECEVEAMKKANKEFDAFMTDKKNKN